MEINISKKDIIWSYISKFFNLASGFITLPLILNKLSAEEVGLNYLMLTISTMVSLLDFGFAPQFGRNITYVLSGSQQIQKDGLDTKNTINNINYHLLSSILQAAKYIYRKLSIVVFALMITFGTIYIYHVTNHFSSVEYTLPIWICFCVSVYFNVYYTYYSSLLTGAALIKEAQIAMMLSRTCYIFIAYLLLLLDLGLISIVIANLVSPFINRYYSHIHFYTKELKIKLANVTVDKKDIHSVIQSLWYNAKKLGLNFIGAYCLTQGTVFVTGLYLSLSEVGSYGLMIQLTSILTGISCTLVNTYIPKFNKYRAIGDKVSLIKDFSMSMVVFYIMTIIGSVIIICFGPIILTLIHSKTSLPSTLTVCIFCLMSLLNMNHAQCATFITTANKVPFVKAGLIAGFTILGLTTIVLHFTTWGLLGVVMVRFIVQLCYNDWYWPRWVLKDLRIGPLTFIKTGIQQLQIKIINPIFFKR